MSLHPKFSFAAKYYFLNNSEKGQDRHTWHEQNRNIRKMQVSPAHGIIFSFQSSSEERRKPAGLARRASELAKVPYGRVIRKPYSTSSNPYSSSLFFEVSPHDAKTPAVSFTAAPGSEGATASPFSLFFPVKLSQDPRGRNTMRIIGDITALLYCHLCREKHNNGGWSERANRHSQADKSPHATLCT
ncbi:hypothetical protein B9Z19DRAFT_695142 [Tuber borchii]|uniref:Uncharacterized protein n=1 Tax=Tuber borchii TaxID=42251 RepID=A0A2T6ZA07_TUBBO|nr:hypothetical protein B9Z19DRAFT_695142 [Tuber borchii]